MASFLCVLCALPVLALAQAKTWTLPPGAAAETNPISGLPNVLKKGESLYTSNCAGCHGPTGLGDGPNVDKNDRAHRPANLTLSRNPEGVVFYKIWNGRKDPDMPEFKSRLTKNEAWAIVAFVTGPLRSQAPSSSPQSSQ
ncbi:MAG TPA: c-type cytochrome [Vicinamibacterales bacterium]|nr:c-type cytochrome [Vicinamibacterales bacterium]